jgi:hypothetical protein
VRQYSKKVDRGKAAAAVSMAAMAVSETLHSYSTLTLACMTALQGRVVSRAYTNLHNTHRTPPSRTSGTKKNEMYGVQFKFDEKKTVL